MHRSIIAAFLFLAACAAQQERGPSLSANRAMPASEFTEAWSEATNHCNAGRFEDASAIVLMASVRAHQSVGETSPAMLRAQAYANLVKLVEWSDCYLPEPAKAELYALMIRYNQDALRDDLPDRDRASLLRNVSTGARLLGMPPETVNHYMIRAQRFYTP